MSISRKIKVVCLGFIAVIIVLGGLAGWQTTTLSRLVVTIYDHSFVGMSYVNQADEAFLHLASHSDSDSLPEGSALIEADVQAILDDLEIAVERASSERTRRAAQSLHEAVRGLPGLPHAELQKRIPALDQAMTKLVDRFASDGLSARDKAEAETRLDLFLMLVEAVSAAMLTAALGWATIRNLAPPLVDVVSILRELAAGAIARPMSARILRRNDEIGEVARATRLFGDTLQLNVQLAHFDTLTGLANRKLFNDRLRQAVIVADRSGVSMALLCLDLDRFKIVNDTLGHLAGDQLLREVAARLQRNLREVDTVARLGGDEFAIILQVVDDPAIAADLSARIIEELSSPYDIDGQQAAIGTSIGIATFSGGAADTTELMRNADLALYRAKEDGRGVYRFFEPEMDTLAQQRRSLEHDLRQACAKGELELYYQPLFNAETLEQIGSEALLRWNHPQRGQISPSEFIAVAEESRLILPIGRWVIDTACRTAAGWPRTQRVAVNVSPVQFSDAQLVPTVVEALARHGLTADRLELEITEGVLIDDTERVLAVLNQLKAVGVRIALDDFGTGYSSLSYLRRFPFDKLKIDRSFVQGIGLDKEADTLVSAIVALGHSMALEVTAEGVETQEQVNLLQQLRCDNFQGFLFGRPAAAGTTSQGGASFPRQPTETKKILPATPDLRCAS